MIFPGKAFMAGNRVRMAQRVAAMLPMTALLLAALLGLCACARPEGVLAPVAAGDAGGDKVDLLAATSRAPSERPGVLFSGERGSGLSFTNLVVSIPSDRAVGSIQWPNPGREDPARDFVVTRAEPLPRSGIVRWFNAQPRDRRRVLIFVHGFNTRFDSAVFGFAQFVHDTGADLTPVLFSWPSRGSITEYVYDRESANFSRSDLAYVLTEATKSPKVDEVIVFAHSMGAWLTVEALRDMALRQGRIPAKISNVVLASPDLDIDVFERQLQEMGPNRPKVTIFTSRDDRALSLSSFIGGRVTRLGAVDLSDPAYVARLEEAGGLTVVDLSALRGGDSLNHSKFMTQPDMVQLIGDRLSAGDTGNGDTAAGMAAGTDAVQAVGTAVGAVITAPITVLRAGAAAAAN